MNKTILTLINDMKTRIEELEEENKKIKLQKQHLSTTIFDNRYTIRQLKSELKKAQRTQRIIRYDRNAA